MVLSLVLAFRKIITGTLATTLLLSAMAASAAEKRAGKDAEKGTLPPRSEWKASSSTPTTPAMAPANAIDSDATTRWGGAFSAGHWFELDMGRVATVGGLLLHWDSGFAASYQIQSSVDGKRWTTAYETTDSRGDVEYLFFPAVKARFLRLASVPRTADWGVSVFNFEPLALQDTARITGVAAGRDAATLWSPGPARRLTQRSGADASARELRITLPRPLRVAGLEVTWGGPRKSARLDALQDMSGWHSLATDLEGLGDSSYLAAREAHTVSELRLVVKGGAPAVRRLKLLAPPRVLTPMKRYEVTASRAHSALFPSTLHARQVYWTALGIPGGRQKSIFDEYGNLEAYKGAPLVQPLWRDASGRTAAAHNARLKHALNAGWMPMPVVEWSPQPGLTLRSEAVTTEHNGQPVTLLRHRLHNTGKRPVSGQLALVVRPMQMNPPWQSGGPSPIRRIQLEGTPRQTAVRVNGHVLLHAITPVDSRGAAPFGGHGETEITRHVPAGTAPAAQSAEDDDGLAAALLNYRVKLAPGAQHDVVLAFPLGTERIDPQAATQPDVPAIDRAAFARYDDVATEVAAQWEARVGGIDLTLPDMSLVHMLRAQAAYMLINQTGPAIQPGPRNYNRSFIRDGSATAALLLRVGQQKTARDYLHWYASHAVHPNGLVSPILNDDGSVNRGFGSDLEHDSQGQFIHLVAEVARLDGGAASVRDYQPHVTRALKFLQELRERTLVPGYLADREAPERFHGLLAPSISHEGYSSPTHSYWDDYWGLRGWRDGAWLLQSWGDSEGAAWAQHQYDALRASVAASIRRTMAWKQIDFIPAAADLGDGDPTSVSIALDPTGQQDLLPAEALNTTFDRYLTDVRKRTKPGSLWAYTPYEMRNVLTYVHLNRPQVANELLGLLMNDRRPPEWQMFPEVVHSRVRHPGYLGDMPHTWIGAEYMRAIFGMLFHEADNGLRLLPGAPPAWLAGDGLRIGDLPTAYGRLTMTAHQENNVMRVMLAPGLRHDAPVHVAWPDRRKPTTVRVDGVLHSLYTTDGIRLVRPFRELVAQW